VREAGLSEIGNAWLIVLIQQDVGGFEIAMQDSLGMCVEQANGNFPK
jgi:hypothetical protein